MLNKLLVGLLLCASLCLTSGRALAQQGGGFPNLGNIGPSKAEVVGAIVGAAAVIGVVVYLVIPKKKTIEGCVVSGDGGLQLTNGKDKRTYALDANTLNLQPGQRVILKGKPGKKHSGTRDFGVNKLVKDEGTCSERATLPSPRPERQTTAVLPVRETVFTRESIEGINVAYPFAFEDYLPPP